MGEVANNNKINHRVFSLVSDTYYKTNRSNPVAIPLDNFLAENISSKTVCHSLEQLRIKGQIKRWRFGSGYINEGKENKMIPVITNDYDLFDMYGVDDEYSLFLIEVEESNLLSSEKSEIKNYSYIFNEDGKLIIDGKPKILFEKDSGRYKIFMELVKAKGKPVSTKNLKTISGKKDDKDIYKEMPRIEESLAKVLGQKFIKGEIIENLRKTGWKLLINITTK